MVEAFVVLPDPQEPMGEVGAPKPTIKVLEASDTYGKFSIEPLERGFGVTLGNPLRRVLLSSIPGAAVVWVRIDGVLHEYSSIPHMREEVLEFLQNVKELRLRAVSGQGGRLHLSATGPGPVKAKDLIVPPDFEIVNPELALAHLDSSDGQLSAEFNVELGQGYMPAQASNDLPIGTLPVDAIFSPVRKVSYEVQRTRVGQVTDYDRLVLEVWSDGATTPTEAVSKAAQGLVDHFRLVASLGQEPGADGAVEASGLSIPAEVAKTSLERLELSSRTLNCLKRAGINNVGGVLLQTRADLMKIRNFGEKSFVELVNRLREKSFPVPEEWGASEASKEANALEEREE